MRALAKPRELAEREVPAWISAPLVALAFGTLLWLERRRPLRRRTESKARRDVRNLAVAALSAAALGRFEKPLVLPLSRWVRRRRFGLLQLVRLPLALEVALGVVLLDYTLWVWHVLTHEVRPLWRLHQVHHADGDLDASTAIRFHFTEMIASVPWRAAQVALLGTSTLALTTWQTLTLVAILFHHSDVELPLALEEKLGRWIMTPRLHGIHHSIVKDERDSNWATIFTWPDRLHGTARVDVPQDEITIGIAERPDPEERTLGKLLLMPLRRTDDPTVRRSLGERERRAVGQSPPVPSGARAGGIPPAVRAGGNVGGEARAKPPANARGSAYPARTR